MAHKVQVTVHFLQRLKIRVKDKILSFILLRLKSIKCNQFVSMIHSFYCKPQPFGGLNLRHPKK